ncbi:MAG: Trk system potassium transporter TrkA [Gammaproteobacteria bacterium]|nr:Trk system potassium transporter TrkA [Gammaproteobacteria bacterium]
MKIIVLGAGQVGRTVAENLAHENNDVTVVDTNNQVLQELQNRTDLRAVLGQASYPDVLREAGAEDADMIIAATDSDETNIVAIQIAYTLFRTPSKIARIRSREYIREKHLFDNDHIPINAVISPETLVTDHIQRIIEHPGAIQVVDFAHGKVRLVGVKVDDNAPLAGKPLSTLRQNLPDVKTRVTAIYRREEAIIPKGDTEILADDIVFFLGERNRTAEVMAQFHRVDRPSRRVMIAGGGNIGSALAQRLSSHYRVKIIERDATRAQWLSSYLESNRTVVLHGDAANYEMLREEGIDDQDFFCALTNDDEANILSAMQAKSMGAGKIMSLINRKEYVELVEKDIIDVAISPHQITIGALLTHIRRGDVVAVHSLRKGSAEALEGVAHGDPETSPVVGRAIEDIELPQDATIGAVVRGEEVFIAHHDLVIEPEDHLIVLVVNKSQIAEVEKLFQVGLTFI